MKTYRRELERFLKHRWFMLSVLFVAILSYGYAATNQAVSMDDLRDEHYVGSGNVMLSIGRFGMTLLYRVLSPFISSGPLWSYTADVLAVAMLILAAITCCILFIRCSGDRFSMPSYTIFACLFISYPLIHEIWEYTGVNVCIAGGYWLAAVATLLIWDVCHRRLSHWGGLTAATLLLMCIISAYESLAAVYILLVFAALTLQVVFGQGEEAKLLTVLKQGLLYAAALVLALILKEAVWKALLWMLQIPETNNTIRATAIFWLERDFMRVLKGLKFSIVNKYLLNSIVYAPLTEVLAATVGFGLWTVVTAIRRKRPALLLTGFGVLLSLLVLSLVQGEATPYRTCQVFAPFVAFAGLLLTDWLWRRKREWVRYTCFALVFLLCIHQAQTLNYYLTLNTVRSSQEMTMVDQIANDAQKDYDVSKPVVLICQKPCLSGMVGQYNRPHAADWQWKLYEKLFVPFNMVDPEETDVRQNPIIQTSSTSVLEWAYTAPLWHDYADDLYDIFYFRGYEINLHYDAVLRNEALAYVQHNAVPVYPQSGYIVDRGSYLLVNVS